VFLFLIQRVLGEAAAAKLEETIGGRVCPNFFSPETTSPFIMLVHHSHSFFGLDPLRYVQRTFFPEGFPAHPHRGFVTVTYILKGGFSHRDSLGMKQMYGAEERHDGRHTQWLTTGAGMLHEEMFDVQGIWSRQELYQLWLNLPASEKLCAPKVDLLGDDECPVIEQDGGKTLVLAGEFGGKKSVAPNLSDVSIFHVALTPGATWNHVLPSSHQTAILYVRQGTIQIGSTTVLPHYTVYFGKLGNELSITTDAGADFMFLSGAPLNEPVAAQGSMVMNAPDEINQAYADYQLQKMGVPWDHKISDAEWKDHVREFPSVYGARQ
jgi:redox-sensitive bicupin YhaK (pirin superfamily)